MQTRKNIIAMKNLKNLKKLSRTELKEVTGAGKVPTSAFTDFCEPGPKDICGQYGLSCGINMTWQNGHVIATNMACM